MVVVAKGQQYDLGEKLTVVLYTYIDRQVHQSIGKRRDEPGYHSILLYWVWDRVGVNPVICIFGANGR